MREIESLLDSEGQAARDRHGLLSILADAYEEGNFPAPRNATRQELVEFMAAQRGLGQGELVIVDHDCWREQLDVAACAASGADQPSLVWVLDYLDVGYADLAHGHTNAFELAALQAVGRPEHKPFAAGTHEQEALPAQCRVDL